MGISGSTLLINAIKNGTHEYGLFKYINDYPDILDNVDDRGDSALMWAIYTDNINIAKLLIEKGVDLDIKNNFGDTALIWVSQRYDFKFILIAGLLIDKGADLNIRNNKGDTALISASNINNIDMVKLLIDKGADLNIKNNAGETALTRTSNVKIAKFLINEGADINIKNIYGKTVLMTAIETKDINFVKLLIENNIQIENHSSILEYCKSLGLDEIYEVLKNYMLGFK